MTTKATPEPSSILDANRPFGDNWDDLGLEICRSAAGYYIGRTAEDGSPMSRDSVEYWPSKCAAIAAVKSGRWTLRTHD